MTEDSARASLEALTANLEKVIVGKPGAVTHTVLALICDGHLLIEDVPGLGKTMLARALATSVDGGFKRVQFTPDLLPTDVTGISVFNPQSRQFEFRPGPVFAHVVVADEINRGTPRAQSSLLEAMEERTVTNDGVTHPLPRPFLVIATQNPIELRGTFPLPEAQLDRFLGSIQLGYPEPGDEKAILERQALRHPIDGLRPVLSIDRVLELQEAVREVYVDDTIRDYLVRVSGATRVHEEVLIGASPRATLGLMRASQGLSLIKGESFVTPDTVKEVAEFALAHRIILRPRSKITQVSRTDIVRSALGSVEVPIR